MMRCGLLGEKLGHSYSPAIHAELADYAYKLYEVAPDALAAFLTGGDFDALNVTIPYKKAVIPYCAALSPIAQKLGSVNVLVRRPDGTLYGDNADAFGFEYLVRRSGVDVAGKKALVLGNGGASATIQAVLAQLGARVTVISRSGEDNYTNLGRHADAQVIVNTTPVGMYPNTGKAAVDLRQFPQCALVLDVVYNPARTALLLQAEALGIPCAGGLYMLVAQAKRSCEVFTGTSIDDGEILRIYRRMRQEMENIVLIGMPAAARARSRRCSPSGCTGRCSTAMRRSSRRRGVPSRISLPPTARTPSARWRQPRSQSSASARARSLQRAAAASAARKITRSCTRTARSSGCGATLRCCRRTGVPSPSAATSPSSMRSVSRCTPALPTRSSTTTAHRSRRCSRSWRCWHEISRHQRAEPEPARPA